MPDFTDPRLVLPEGGLRQRMQVNAGVAAIRKSAAPDATQVSQALHGETVLLHHEIGEFGLVQNETDNYVGFVLMEALSSPVLEPTHRIKAARLHSYSEPKLTAAPHF